MEHLYFLQIFLNLSRGMSFPNLTNLFGCSGAGFFKQFSAFGIVRIETAYCTAANGDKIVLKACFQSAGGDTLGSCMKSFSTVMAWNKDQPCTPSIKEWWAMQTIKLSFSLNSGIRKNLSGGLLYRSISNCICSFTVTWRASIVWTPSTLKQISGHILSNADSLIIW